MRVSELKRILNEFDDDLEVLITDGFNARCYRGAFSVESFIDLDGYEFADIGIGGCEEE